MKDSLLLSLTKFLKTHHLPGKPVVLGYSGGPDSKTLLHLLLLLKQRVALDLHLAHVDHSWREESAAEAEALRMEALNAGIPFHLHTLTATRLPEKNLEAEGRGERLRFFKALYAKLGAQALLLGHQADDQAETVLKRIFEGAHLRHVGGMSPAGELEGMVVWRPLLSHSKEELLAWLEKRGFAALYDSTNTDPRFLRGRMRQDLLPKLAGAFGKQIHRNLCHFGQVAEELAAYFSKVLTPYFSKLQTNAEGSLWDLSSVYLEKVEWEYLLREWMVREKLTLSREVFSQCVHHLQHKKKKRLFLLKQGVLEINCGVFLFKRFLK